MPDLPLLGRGTLFQTGDSLSGTVSTYCIDLPDDDWALEAFNAALTLLCDVDRWQQAGEATTQDATNLFIAASLSFPGV
jgi:hypothetical protein